MRKNSLPNSLSRISAPLSLWTDLTEKLFECVLCCHLKPTSWWFNTKWHGSPGISYRNLLHTEVAGTKSSHLGILTNSLTLPYSSGCWFLREGKSPGKSGGGGNRKYILMPLKTRLFLPKEKESSPTFSSGNKFLCLFLCLSPSSPSLFPLSTHKNAQESLKHPTTQKQCQESIYYSAFRITSLPSEIVQYWVIE